MYSNVSDAFLAKLESPSRHFVARFSDSGTPVDLFVKGITKTTGSCGGTSLMVGCAYAGYIDVTAAYSSAVLEGHELYLELGLLLDDGTYEYIPYGYWMVQKPVKSKDMMTFQAVDRMAGMFHDDYETELTYPATIADVLTEFSQKTGVTVICDMQTSVTIPGAIQGVTQRGALAIIAATLLGNAWIDRNGAVRITPLISGTQVSINYNRVKTQPEMDEVATEIEGVKVFTVAGKTDTYIERGSGNMVSLSDIYMTDTALDAVKNNLIGLTYGGGSVSFMGNPLLDPSDTIYFRGGSDMQEYMLVTETDASIITGNNDEMSAYDVASYYIPCMEIVESFDGGLLSTITAPGKFEKTDSTIVVGAVTEELRRQQGEIDEAKEAADDAADAADAAQTTADNALTMANGKNKTYFQSSAPTTGMTAGDLWFDTAHGNALYEYKVTGTTGTWTLRQFGQGSIVAGSITANEIYVNALSAISANIGTVTAGILKSSDYAYSSGNYSTAGMCIDLNNKIIRSPKFAVDANGNTYTSGGIVGGWTIGSNIIEKYTDAVTIDGNQYKFRAYMYAPTSPGVVGSVSNAFAVYRYDWDGTNTSNPYWMTIMRYDGKLFARNASVSGEITATSGYIGNGTNGFTIDSNGFYSGTKAGTTAGYISLSNADFARSINGTSRTLRFAIGSKFGVGSDGTLYAAGADIAGKIISTEGTIGGWTISSTALESAVTVSSKTYTAILQNMSGTDLTRMAFGVHVVPNGTPDYYPFRVQYDGTVYMNNVQASGGTIGPWTISDDAFCKNAQSIGQAGIYIGTEGISYVEGSANIHISYTSDIGRAYFVDTTGHRGVYINMSGGFDDREAHICGSSIALFKYGDASSLFTVQTVQSGTTYYSELTLSNTASVGNAIRLGGDDGGIYCEYTNAATRISTNYKTYANTGTGVLLTSAGAITASGSIATDNKTFGADGTTGVFVTGTGNIHLTHGSAGSSLFFYYNTSTSITSQIYESSSGVITVYSSGFRATGAYSTTTTNAANVNVASDGTLARYSSSSRRYKHDIKPLTDYRKVLDIPVVSFVYNDDYIHESDQRYRKDIPGLIAEDVSYYYPIAADIVNGQVEDWNSRYIIPPMLAVLEEHDNRIAALEMENQFLRAEIAQLKEVA